MLCIRGCIWNRCLFDILGILNYGSVDSISKNYPFISAYIIKLQYAKLFEIKNQMKESKTRMGYSTPQSYKSKRFSLSSSKKGKLDSYLNQSIEFKRNIKCCISTSTEANPEYYRNTPINMLHESVRNKRKSKSRVERKKAKNIKSEVEIENTLKQDVKLRVLESVHLGQWMELLQEYKQNLPRKSSQVNVVLREFEKIIQLKEDLQIRKYKLISNLI